ncbi:MAG: type II toxin-antitoxin system VapC family toxin [Gammaproteobacteria bacterium]|nr:type II toxin-antitoxin system VapC family toxin [Gammaproteobacteria bacterium]
MYLLDTNVVSELRKPSSRIDHRVRAWAARTPSGDLYLSVIVLLELEMGVLAIERRDVVQGERLRKWLQGQVLPAFAERTLAIDATVARTCAKLHVPDRRPDRDALIAATALSHSMTVVTRNVSDFASIDVPTINPWAEATT